MDTHNLSMKNDQKNRLCRSVGFKKIEIKYEAFILVLFAYFMICLQA